MCCPCCPNLYAQTFDMENVVENIVDDDGYQYTGTLCGRDVYCRLPTLCGQYFYAAMYFSSAGLGAAGAILWAASINPLAGKILGVCALLPYVAVVVHIVKENMRCVPHRDVI
jgi:hypothetical protein